MRLGPDPRSAGFDDHDPAKIITTDGRMAKIIIDPAEEMPDAMDVGAHDDHEQRHRREIVKPKTRLSDDPGPKPPAT